jgi:hypothetical protein
MKTIAIMQPTYLPWLGYFDLIDRSDIFVLLDSVQFDKRSWQQRNRIKTPNGELMLTVPVLTKGRSDQNICDVMIDKSQNFEKKHFSSIRENYKKTKYYEKYIEELENIYNKKIDRLSDLNTTLIRWLSSNIGIDTEFLFSSDLNAKGSKTELLFDICNILNGDHYLSPAGSKDYIEKNNLFSKNGIKLSYQNYRHSTYNQLFDDFIPYMSVIDFLFNEGDKSLQNNV